MPERYSDAPSLPWLLLMLGACRTSVAWSRGRDLSADTWQAACIEWQVWLRSKLRGYGSGSVSGSGSGDGYGYGYSDVYVDGDGYGSGYCDGSGDGYGDGADYGDGSGCGHGDGRGYGDGSYYGHGYGFGCGYGDGNGDGYGEQIWLDVVTLEFADGTRLDGDIRAAVIGLLGANLDAAKREQMRR